MKKSILLLSLTALVLSISAQSLNRAQLRELFLQATQRRSALDSMQSILEKNNARSPYEECYLGICNALQIQYINGMWGKYRMLDKSKGHIANGLSQSPQDAELHFVRFMLEHNIPAFLGMSGHIHEDLAFIFRHSDFLDEDADMKKMAVEYILSSKRCTADQRTALERTLEDVKKKLYAQK